MLRPKHTLAVSIFALGQACGYIARGSSCCETVGLFFLFVALSRGVLGKEGMSAATSLTTSQQTKWASAFSKIKAPALLQRCTERGCLWKGLNTEQNQSTAKPPNPEIT